MLSSCRLQYYQITASPHPFQGPYTKPLYNAQVYLCNPDSRAAIKFTDSTGTQLTLQGSLLFGLGTTDLADFADWVEEAVSALTASSQVRSRSVVEARTVILPALM